jgi:CP family cyanate transporter-like MFS transporter
VLSAVAAIAAGIAVPIAGLTHEGWRWSLGIWAALAVVGVVVLAPHLRRPMALRAGPAPVASEMPADRSRSPWTSALGWQVTVFMGVQSAIYFILITWLPSIEQSTGISATTAGFHQLLLNTGGIAGSLLTAAAIHRRPHDQRPIAVVISLLIGVGLTAELLMPSLSTLWVCVIGLGTGGTISLALSLFALRAINPRQAADLSGMAQTIGYLMAATGPIAIGILHDATGSWSAALVVVLVLVVAQLVISVLAARDRQIG